MAQTYLNKKQELFCQFLAKGSTQIEAYELAGYEPSAANASTLANKPIVKKRVEELKADYERQELEFKVLAHQADQADPVLGQEIATGAMWNFQRVMDMMGTNVRLAQVAGEYKAANECLKMMAEAMKMFDTAKDKHSHGNDSSAQGPLAVIGRLTQIIERQGVGSGEEGDNPLAPRLDRARHAESVERD